MMLNSFSIIFKNWISSLSIFRPRALTSLFHESIARFLYSFKIVLHLFWWLFILDIGLTLIFKCYLCQAANAGTLPQNLLVGLALSVIGIIVHTTFLLFVRSRSDQFSLTDYCKIYAVRFVRMRLAFVFLYMLLSIIFAASGMKEITHVPLYIILPVKFLENITMFFWLDSAAHHKDIFSSFERGVNLLFYNIPLFLVLILTIVCGYKLILLLLSLGIPLHEKKSLIQDAMLWISKLPLSYAIVFTLIERILLIVTEFFVLSMTYTYYKQKRGKSYTYHIFE